MVSVVIPVFNKKEYVIEMIQCIISQTFKNWELILVDDGSTDGTLETLYELSKTNDKILVYERNRLPKGAQTCRNIGLQLATKPYIIFLDSDDLISKTCLMKRVEFMELNKEIDYGIFPAKSFSSNQQHSKVLKNNVIWGIKNNMAKSFDDDLLFFMMAKYPFIVVTNIYKRKSLLNNNIYWDENVKIYQDFDFIFNTFMSNLTYKYAIESDCEYIDFDYFYRISYSSDTTSSFHISNDKFNSTIYLFNKVLVLLKKNNKSQYFIDAFFQFILLYYKRIIFSKSFSYLIPYLKFCKLHYSENKILKLRMVSNLLKYSKDLKVYKFYYFVLLHLFFPTYEFKITFQSIKRKFNLE